METLRKPLQGVTNILRFNWHFYVAAILLALTLWGCTSFIGEDLKWITILLGILSLIPVISSLLVSYYIYDASGLYRLKWIKKLEIKENDYIANISAGFDETSDLLVEKYPKAIITRFDFYNTEKHTEIAIERARRRYPPHPSTIKLDTERIPLETNAVDKTLVIFSAHEIRNPKERVSFLKEIHRSLKENGTLIVVEHLRDLPNFLAFNIGCFHFYSKKDWLASFAKADLKLANEFKINPFISTFILKK